MVVVVGIGADFRNFNQSGNFCWLPDIQRTTERLYLPFHEGVFVGRIHKISTIGKVVTYVGCGQEMGGSRHNLKIRQHFRR